MSFVLFLMLNAILLIRPEELQPEIAGLRLYLIVIGLNVLLALPQIIQRLQPAELVKRPITICVLGLWGVTALSLIVHGRLNDAADFAAEFGKVVVYYLLLVAVIDSPARLRSFLGFLVLFIAVVAVLGLLQHFEVIDHPALRPVEQREYDPNTGEMIAYPRLCSTGIFNDPNDLCLVLSMGIVCCLYHAVTAGGGFVSLAWLVPAGLFGYAIVLTKSRGGLLGLMAALAAYLVARFGWRRAVPAIVLGAPIALLALGGRQANISLGNSDTAYTRVMLWAEGITALFGSMRNWFTGIGAGRFAEEMGLEAHNSFVHAYVELGLLGGSLFLLAFVTAARMLQRLSALPHSPVPAALRYFPALLLAMLVGYCGGMYSLSRNYVVPTYLCLGLADAYLAMAIAEPPDEFRLSRTWIKQAIFLGVGGLIFLKLFTQVFGSLGQ